MRFISLTVLSLLTIIGCFLSLEIRQSEISPTSYYLGSSSCSSIAISMIGELFIFNI